MRPLRAFFLRLLGVFRGSRAEKEMAEEIESHLLMQLDDNLRAGMSPEEARRAAALQLGGIELTKELCRDRRGIPALEALLQDFRHASRLLWRNPEVTLAAVLTLALGIGVNTAVFSVLNAVLLRRLPFPEPDRLVNIVESSGTKVHDSVNYANFLDWQRHQRSFLAMGVARPFEGNLVTASGAERAAGAMASHDYFAAAGVPTLRGRLFTPQDDRPEAGRTMVLSEALWRRLFGGRDAAIGQSVTFLGLPHEIIGVLPRGFIHTSYDCAFWVPLGHYSREYLLQPARGPQGFLALGRLRPGIDQAAARRELTAVARQLAAAQPVTNLGGSVALQTLAERIFASVRMFLWILFGAAGGVLLIACANFANLQLMRAQARLGEFGLRSALGAGRGRVARLLLVESLLLGLLGSGVGVLLGGWLIHVLRPLLLAGLPRAGEIALDGQVFACALAAGLLFTLLFGLMPVVQVLRSDLAGALAAHGRHAGSASGSRCRTLLVVGEIAATCVLLVGTGLMLRTLQRLYQTDLGYRTSQIVTFTWSPNSEPAPRRRQLVDVALERLRAIPGVEQVGVSELMPLDRRLQLSTVFTVEGDLPAAAGQAPSLDYCRIHRDYLETLQIPLVKGRGFNAYDTAQSPRVVLIDTWLAERHFRGRDPIGRRIKFGLPGGPEPWLEIVGVVTHVQTKAPGLPAGPQAYLHDMQSSPPFVVTFAARTGTDFAALRPLLEKAMREVAPGIPIYSAGTLGERFDASISTQRMMGLLLSIFAALALALAAVGLYGVLNYWVNLRTRELGVRLALGAHPGQVQRLVLLQGLGMAGRGLLLGVPITLAATRLLRGLVYGVSTLDPLSFVAAGTVLIAVCVLACWIPTRRATGLDPAVVLRCE